MRGIWSESCGSEEDSCARNWEKCVPGIGNSKHKGPEAGPRIGLLGEKKEGRMDGKEHRKREVGVKGSNGGLVRNGSLVLLRGCHQG